MVGIARFTACVVIVFATLAAGNVLARPATLAAQPSDDALASVRTTLAAAHATLLAKLAAAEKHSDDAYDIVYRLNEETAELDAARARSDTAYVRERELAANLDAAWVEAVTTGTCGPPSTVAGAAESCFRSTIDGTLQPLALYVPSGASQAPPVVVILRGRGQTESDLLARHDMRALADTEHALLIAPYARGRAIYDRTSTQDVLDALSAVERARQVDRARVYLAGYSMGGIAAFHVAAAAPRRFAAVLSIAGALDGADRDALRAFAERPAYVVNGENDDIILPAHGRAAARDLRAIGVLARYYEQPHGTHELHSLQPGVAAAWHDMFAGVTAATTLPLPRPPPQPGTPHSS